jgi:hypothetical protein
MPNSLYCAEDTHTLLFPTTNAKCPSHFTLIMFHEYKFWRFSFWDFLRAFVASFHSHPNSTVSTHFSNSFYLSFSQNWIENVGLSVCLYIAYTHTHVSIPPYDRTYIHTHIYYIHKYIHTYTHTHINTFKITYNGGFICIWKPKITVSVMCRPIKM